ncbi:immunity protein 51 of polymorphic toxin system [Stackebrandtia albiflava]|uniref:Immunity protein 51 of polymorphic toxin system n=1 Tax=Stackebrandtia albiflava TaxID=406432 RepID=A0A562VD66_9ACTN|nr:Imm51 family immunity protein [Stackebrandtia albiflava]TWJ15833.1 immunity protein 51 of polymorphic toxin system [Stackebrandtia albiflava]
MTDTSQNKGFTHVKMVTGGHGSSIILSAGGPADAHLAGVFAEFGLEGSGYDWQSAVAGRLALDGTGVPDGVAFDSEAGMFCAYGSDTSGLLRIGAVVEGRLADAESLRAALTEVREKDLWAD